MLARVGLWCFSNPRKTVAVWGGVILAVVIALSSVGSAFDSRFDTPHSESRSGREVLAEHFGDRASRASGAIVFGADSGVHDPEVRTAIERMLAEVAAIEGVIVTSPFAPEQPGQGVAQGSPAGEGAADVLYAGDGRQISVDGRIAYAGVNFAPDVDFGTAPQLAAEIARLAPDDPGLQVEIAGDALAPLHAPESEFIGLAFAIVVLIVAFGSVLAMGLPIAVAGAGVGLGAALTALLSNLLAIPDFAVSIGAMIGLGAGIDYALFIVNRYRDGLRSGGNGGAERPMRRAIDTAGRAVIFAGVTVVISLLGMILIDLPFVTGMAVSAALTVTATMLAAVTLLPALIGFVRERIEVTRWRGLLAAAFGAVALLGLGVGFQPLLIGAPLALLVLLAGSVLPPLRRIVPRRAPRPLQRTLAWRWSRRVQAHPWVALVGGAALLLAVAAPIPSLRLNFPDESNYPEETTTRRAYDLLAEGFGPGINGPLIVTAQPAVAGDRAALVALAEAIEGTEGVAAASGPLPSDPLDPANAPAYMIQVVPESAPQDEATSDLVQRLRHEVVPSAVAGSTLDVNVTGMMATSIDITSYLAGRTPIFVAVVLALSFVLLMIVFRSVLVPLKAVVMNMLSIAAAFGVVVAVFQWGWLGSLFGIAGGPIDPFIPMMMFAIVFGLSMDYEVFLLSRVREAYFGGGERSDSVAHGLASTAHLITAAAAIMVVVFGSFVFEDYRPLKMFGFGLAVAVALDATVVRMLLVPATMALLGERNWWLPGWLDRVLPRFSLEGEASP